MEMRNANSLHVKKTAFSLHVPFQAKRKLGFLYTSQPSSFISVHLRSSVFKNLFEPQRAQRAQRRFFVSFVSFVAKSKFNRDKKDKSDEKQDGLGSLSYASCSFWLKKHLTMMNADARRWGKGLELDALVSKGMRRQGYGM